MASDDASDVVTAEAVAWIIRLNGSARSAAEEAAFREWLQADPVHARAFSRATDVWELIPGAAGVQTAGEEWLPQRQPLRPANFKRPLVGLAVAACVALIAVLILRAPTYSTLVGQQQTVVLPDGSRLSLNTDTRIAVNYSEGERRIRLQRGEALFEVAKNPRRPFIVEVGNQRVRALGTRFVVRRDSEHMSVTLIDGSVTVGREATSQVRAAGTVVLKPGERITTWESAVRTAEVDRPKLQTVAAWRRGEVMFDDVSLQDAADELARYGGPRLTMATPEIARLRVSGVFATSDPEEFAQTMAQMYQLKVAHDGVQIELSH